MFTANGDSSADARYTGTAATSGAIRGASPETIHRHIVSTSGVQAPATIGEEPSPSTDRNVCRSPAIRVTARDPRPGPHAATTDG
ncbi:hypothetical protein GCM10023175_17810 [Pseudonocardia xishanensis]|uniref:Uncharacterized protein n=1 Tax=Pseudonocardia xishanensis TaxID=630995 RepID=A0ABP8RLX7_9PSEU